MNIPPFTIIIPCYNEEDGIESTIDSLCRKLTPVKEYELIAVDDGSNDGTADLLERITQCNQQISIQSHRTNCGYGAALKTGLHWASYDIVVIIDADGTYPQRKILDLLRIFEREQADMVVGARITANAHIPFLRRPAKWVLRKLASFLTETAIPDLNSGMRVMRKSVVEQYLRLLPDGFSFTSTITLAMLTNKHVVLYEPIDYFERTGKSKIRPIYDTLNFIQLILRMVMYFNPLKVFVPLSLTLVGGAFCLLVGSWLFLDRIMDVSFGIMLMTAIVVLAIGMLADFIDKRVV